MAVAGGAGLSVAMLGLCAVDLVNVFLLFRGRGETILFVLFLVFVGVTIFAIVILSGGGRVGVGFVMNGSEGGRVMSDFVLGKSARFLTMVLFKVFS